MHKLRVIPLGGCGEIGKNMTLFEYNNQVILVDAGIMFPENDHLGIDYIIPDMGYVMENLNRLKIVGIIVTHGHEDHTGAIGHVMEIVDAPIYATPLTAGILKLKLKEAKQHHAKVNVIQAGDKFKLGVFEIETFHVTHSIPDCVGLGIRTPVGLVVHTGDFKFDHTPVDGWPPDFGRIARFGQEGVLALFSDSTNADRPGWTPSETLVADGFDRVFARAKGRIMVATFASLISRVEQVADTCQKYNRKMALVGHSMIAYIGLSFELGYLKFPQNLIVPVSKANKLPPEQVVYMVTGSQGEPSAVLSRLALGRQPQLDIHKGDTVIISAHPIPGNEEMIQRTINKLIQKGADVVYDPIEQVHVSGHASQEEMKLMINMVRPRYFIPVHGELRHLHSHTRLATRLGIPEENCAIIENGTILEFTQDSMTIGERYPGGYVFVDGRGVGDIGPAVMRDREILGSEGFVTIFVVVDRKGNIVKEPRIISRGFVYLRESEHLVEVIKETIRRTLTKTTNGRRNEQVEEAVSRIIYQETKRRPMVFAHVHQEVAE
jgi:ribonuclease J